ncbi:hypothetical protein BCR43DRAFT_530163 [Syncephalastrum racemosum]|uniref:Uncharacterized protein n=1 Tax=Syncephalastrum racemosum TaxID=13706 RepID=A0A1X2HHW0_SYNRA|nr:hypothetical protein BCR43DRAFT_530163 [Syncephalastrum racemosum]
MTYGAQLRSQVPVILDHVSEGVQNLQRCRNFVKERANIERDYAHKLEQLAKKYKPSDKIQGSMEDAEWDSSLSTSSIAWHDILSQTEQVAKSRSDLAEILITSVADVAKTTAARKEEARKKLKAERDKIYTEKDKAKQAYDDVCVEVQNIQNKMHKASGDTEKYEKQLNHALLECDDKKNAYLLALRVANTEREKFFEEDLPTLADALISVTKIDPAVDADVFARDTCSRMDVNDPTASVRFTFVPWNGGAHAAEIAIDRDSNLVTDDAASHFLNNKLLKGYRQLTRLGDELSTRSEELHQLKLVVQQVGSKAFPEYDDAMERLVETARQITLLSTQKARVKSEVDLIVQSIGDTGLDAQAHDFKPSSFTIPTTCDLCNTTIWGLSKQGLTCKACGFNCHSKCEMKVSLNCSLVKGKINRRPTAVSSRASMIASGRPSLSEESRSVNEAAMSPSEETPSPVAVSVSAGSAASAADTTAQTSRSMTSPMLNKPQVPEQTVYALYDYAPQTHDELAISQGEVLSILERDDGSGWVKASRGHDVGYVPADYVAQEYSERKHDMKETGSSIYQQQQPQEEEEWEGKQEEEEHPPAGIDSQVVVALYDFDAGRADELSFQEGDHIHVLDREDDAWWRGMLNGRTGLFPANYVK